MMRKVSVCIITLGRDTLYKTLESLLTQKTDNFTLEIILILQGTVDSERINALNKEQIPLHIHQYEPGLGFGLYRNAAIKHASGEIIAWIDDDEWTVNDYWLISLTKPIFEQKYQVVTAGTRIELGKGYRTDCMSYLGYPGGSVLGFDKMRTVYNDNTTEHLCSGNFAFHKNTVKDSSIGFDESLKSGAEDVAFAAQLIKKGIKIYREPEATIYHIHRSGVVNFCQWHFLRGKSVYEYMQLGLVTGGQKKDKIRSVKHILFDRFFSRYVFGIWLLLIVQYFCTLCGYCYKKVVD